MMILGTDLNFRKFLKCAFKLVVYLLFLYPIYLFSGFFHKNKKIWVFGGVNDKIFSDNSKYLFLYCCNSAKKKIRFIWVSKNRKIIRELKDKGYEAYFKYSFRAFFNILRAKYFIFSNNSTTINYWLSKGTIKINLWHGVGLKRIDGVISGNPRERIFYLKGFKRLVYKFLIPDRFEEYNYFFITSSFWEKILSPAINVKTEMIIPAGYPRNDILFHKIKDSDIGSDSMALSQIKKIHRENPSTKFIIYVPTYRETGGNPLTDSNFNFKELNELMKLFNSIFLIKLHPGTERQLRNKLNFSAYERIISIHSQTDVYPILSFMDILITDYSSIYSDFLLTNKPVIFFPYDYEEFIAKNRELYFDYDQFTPGPKAYNFTELLNLIRHLLKGKDDYINQRQKIKNIYFKNIDGRASERVFKTILKNDKSFKDIK